MLKTLDLFSGIGGFAVGLEATNFFKTTCFVEQEPYCKEVLRHHFPEVPILGDIKNVKRSDLPEPDPDVILGGFPCQPFSSAGLQKAQSDSRHLWPEMFRLIKECRPSWVIGENVIGIVKLGLDEVLTDLENEGYATRTFNIPACAVGAPHLRQRIWVVAHSDCNRKSNGTLDDSSRQGIVGSSMADPDSYDRGRWSSPQPQERNSRMEHSGGGERLSESRPDPSMDREPRTQTEEHWEFEPSVGRLADGIPNRVSQLRSLGNSIVPQIAKEIGYAIKTAEVSL